VWASFITGLKGSTVKWHLVDSRFSGSAGCAPVTGYKASFLVTGLWLAKASVRQ
jgi:hypothetical protein